MKITKEEFEAIYWIEYMNYNNPKLLSKQINISEEEAKKLLLHFEKEDIIKIERRENKIYGSQLTKKGKEIWNDNSYKKLKEELGY